MVVPLLQAATNEVTERKQVLKAAVAELDDLEAKVRN